MAALRPEQGHRFRDDLAQAARLAFLPLRPAQVEEALQVRLHQSELPQGHVERLGLALARHFLGVDLQRQPGAGDVVAQLVGQAGADLSEQAQALGLPHGFLKLGKLMGHVVDGTAEVAQLVVAARQRHRAEVAGRDLSGTSLQLLDAPAEALGHGHRKDSGRDAAEQAEHQRRLDGGPVRLVEQPLGIEDVQGAAGAAG